VLCTDKTGTLTQNRMTIVELRGEASAWERVGDTVPTGKLAELVRCGVLASAREPFDPMEKAFHELGKESNPNRDVHVGLTLNWEYGLRPDLLAVTNIWQTADRLQLLAASKGAPEAIADLCALDAKERQKMSHAVDELARGGMRVLGVARAVLSPGLPQPDSPRGLPFRFLGLVGLADPLRPAVPAAVTECRTAGIRVVMITGDYPQTARAISEEAGLGAGDIVTGTDLQVMNDAELTECARTTTIFARTMPEQKLRIVQALKANGEVVAMTGDGVNDAPSLKAAHIGIAMGGRGTDVAREASSLVLLDDDFASIVGAIRLGRRIYDNLRKAMAYILAIHVPIAGLALIPLVFGLPLIFWPLHIAFLELVIDPMCSIVFEAEGAASDIMRRRPRDPEEPLFSFGYIAWSLGQGAIVLVFVASLYVLALHQGLPEEDARALTFASLVATNLGLVLLNRARGEHFWAGLCRRNTTLWWVAGGTTLILAAILSIHPLRQLFHFGPLHADDVGVALASGAAVLGLLAVIEHFSRHQERRQVMAYREDCSA
jgi:Ca2+-transporting ATPase